MIKQIKVENFKSFEKIELDLQKFNVLIGPNASGKSNFISIFRFLKDIAVSGLDNAISMQGGVEYLRNIKIGSEKDLSIRVVSDAKFGFMYEYKKPQKPQLVFDIYEVDYEFSLKFHKRGRGFRVNKEILVIKYKWEKVPENLKSKGQKKADKKDIYKNRGLWTEYLSEGEIIFTRSNGNIHFQIKENGKADTERIKILEEFFESPILKGIKLARNVLFIEKPYSVLTFPLIEIFKDIGIYDFDPKLSKKAYPITGKADLEENGENLALILRSIIQNKEKRQKLFNLIKELLPFVENLGVEKFADKSLLFKLKEVYYEEKYIPASLISDGTINATALILALYFDKKNLVIIEEPERNIHPSLISKVVSMMKETSKKKQIIVTTHNPELVKHAGLDNLLLITRDKKGFSQILKPKESKEVQIFLQNEIGIDELYVQNLLEVQ